ncbi:hypothetical protein BD310DRAFT_933180 [Dichomitus squalens]|uniref:Uncharacterized protein n=1 Tax=Dichomitus squalens TaxID=114155 RepID=A0A4Q9PMX7_9APHY|nr:hypothetical protein BD310DRAFT_933180 [Dichomitus squalens]
MDEDDDTPTRAPSAVRSFCANPTFNLEDGSPVHSLDVPGPTAIPQLTEIGSNQPQYPGMQAEARPVVYEYLISSHTCAALPRLSTISTRV